MTLTAGARLGNYEVRSPLGIGGMGEVYRARDVRLDREVALKVLGGEFSSDPTRLMRFEQEARAVSSLNHPHIVGIFDLGQSDHGSYIVMELVEGVTLRELMDTGAIPLKKALTIAEQVADGLAKAHDVGIIHRDLKPENIMVSADGFAKILDFGLVKLAPAAVASGATMTAVAPATSPGIVMGTVSYMSPEQARGAEVDFHADQFAFGSILYEMLTRVRPFSRDSSAQIMAAIIEDDPQPIQQLNPKIPLPVVWIVERCHAKDPQDRYASTRDLARDLRSVRDHLSQATSHISRLDLQPLHVSPWQRYKTVIVGLLALALGIAAGAIFFRQPSEGAPALRYITFSGSDGQPSVSPDGRTIAFSSRRTGKWRIWLKELQGSGEAPLTDGPDDGAPRFSPDGTAVVFERKEEGHAVGSVWRTALLGAEPRKIANVGFSPDWSPDGKQLVYLRFENSQLQVLVCDADGGNARVVTSIELSAHSFIAESVRWSPDGQYFIITTRGRGLTSEAVKLLKLSVDGKQQTWITPSLPGGQMSSVSWANDHTIIYARSESLATAGFNATSVAVMLQDLATGKGRRLVSLPGASTNLSVLGPGKIVLDLATSRQNIGEIQLSGPNAGTSKWLTRGNANDRQPIYSPDGEWVAFSSNRSGNLDIWAVSRKTGVVKRLTDDPADDWDPAYSPDGKHLVWSSHRTGNFEIWIADADGSGAHQVSHDGVDAENPEMSPDGWITYHSGNLKDPGLWKTRADGTGSTLLVKGACNWPAISPNGEYITCNLVDTDHLIVRLSDGSIVSRIKHSGNAGRLRWMPTGNAVVFPARDADGKMYFFRQDVVPGVDTASTRRRLVPIADDRSETFALANDGKTLIYASVDFQSGLVIAEGVSGVEARQK